MCGATSEGEEIGKADIPGHSSCLHGYSCGGLCLDSYFTLRPASLKSVHDSMAHFGGIRRYPPGVWLAMAMAMVTVTVIALVSFYGLLLLRNWAPSLAISAALIGVALSCFTGPVFQSGLGSAFGDAGSMLSGMALILPYACPEVRALFWPQAAAAIVDTAGHQAAAAGTV